MANTIKPNDFSNSPLPLKGSEEVYTQTNGVNNKFTVENIWDGVAQTTNTINTGTTIVNNDTVNISGGTIMISGGTVIFLTGSTSSSGSTSVLTDNGDGTYTHENNGTPNVVTEISPANYSLSELATGEYWIDDKPIYRKVYQLPQWTSIAFQNGKYQLESGDYFDRIVKLKLFAESTSIKSITALNLGDGTDWDGEAYIDYNGVNSFLTWKNIISDIGAYVGNAFDVTLILEYTKK